MKAIINVAITKPQGGIKFVRKAVELSFVPFIGMAIDCIAWKSPRTIQNVTLIFDDDYEDSHLYISMEKEEANSEKEQSVFVEGYKKQGWEV